MHTSFAHWLSHFTELMTKKLSSACAFLFITVMEIQYPQSNVVFRNVGQLYFPQTRIECHYSVTSQHMWSSSDWIGIFKVGWSSLREYHTYAWSLVPEGYNEGSTVDCCALFQAFYLPRPSAVEYCFVYVDKMGKVCAQSRPFTFCAPRPLDELETLMEERNEEDDGEEEEELLLVVPRAQLLQRKLEECMREKAELMQAVDEAKQEIEEERRSNSNAKEDWKSQRDELKEEIENLRQTLTYKCDALKMAEGKHKDVECSQENLNSELTQLTSEKVQSQQQIKDLLEEIKVLTDREKERNVELERLREILMKLSSQIKHDEEKRKLLQAEHEATLVERHGLQSRLEASERSAEGLRTELRELGTRQGHAYAELHQSRLQVAQLGLQLSEEKLLLMEERANWALEREAFRNAAQADKQKMEELRSEMRRKEERLRGETTELEKLQAENQMGQQGDTKQLMLPALVEPVLSELTGSIMW
ncbi:calcium-binding and coiled-coil domain-containing protein 1b isoform X2 [Corythoichthys intestinalis]|uniref:calcium-binding and coiled-coil domain-containing protein 1b isoform X2 n=1 Tax=Corythoichthys intestinalis TaxID=161448 RepID=UPI0025A55BC5|nr:calcium-binding and coiled-coil domain-containing protein 1b isoform X2 [Corythoichthys intestinalis]